MAEDHLKLENQICFSIYATAREVTKLYKPLLEELNVTYPQYLVLLVLWEEDGITVKEMGHRLYLDSGTLTPMLKRMETAGLVFRERSKHDERSVVVRLTEEGKKAEQTADSIPYQLLDQLDMGQEELKQFKASMVKVLQSVHQKNES